MDFELEAKAPFSLASVVLSHGWIRLAPFEEIGDPGSGEGLRTIVQLDSGRVIRIEVTGTDAGVRVRTPTELSASEREQLADTVTWMLGLDQDFSSFYAWCEDEPKLASARTEAKGRLLRSPTLFEDVVKTIATTNTAWSGTKRMVRALVDTYGALATAQDAERAFPTPAALAASSEDELRDIGKLGYRAPYVLELAQRVESGDLDLEAFRDSALSTAALRKELLSITGVGPYAAATLLMLLGRYDYLPVDSWARTMVSREWHGGEPVGEKEIEAAFERWGEWKGLVYWFWQWDDRE